MYDTAAEYTCSVTCCKSVCEFRGWVFKDEVARLNRLEAREVGGDLCV